MTVGKCGIILGVHANDYVTRNAQLSVTCEYPAREYSWSIIAPELVQQGKAVTYLLTFA